MLLHFAELGPAPAAPNPRLQLEALHLDPAFLNRGVNQGFSGAQRLAVCNMMRDAAGLGAALLLAVQRCALQGPCLPACY